MGFRVIAQPDRAAFEKQVSELIDDGYEIVGGVSFTNSIFVVGMVCEDEEEKNVATKSGVPGPKQG